MDINFLIHGLPNFNENELLNPQHEEVDSSAFSSAPENAVVPRFGGQTGEEINAQARANLDKMKRGDFQLDAGPKYITKPSKVTG